MLSLVLYTFVVAGCDDCSTNLVDFDSFSHLLSTMFVYMSCFVSFLINMIILFLRRCIVTNCFNPVSRSAVGYLIGK